VLAEKIIRWTIAYVTAVKCTLRREQVTFLPITSDARGRESAAPTCTLLLHTREGREGQEILTNLLALPLCQDATMVTFLR
jgi:hypothetical protein